MTAKPLDPFSEVVDAQRRWNPEWYSFLAQLADPNVLTVVNLPNAASTNKPARGDRALVTDATGSTFGAIVAGGGSTVVPVYFDGTNWRIG